MKRFTFSLERMRGYKTQLLEREKNTLRQLQRVRFEIEEHITLLEAEFQQVNRDLQADVQKGMAVSKLRLYNFQMENIRSQIAALRWDLAAAQKEVEAQLAVVVTASQEVSGLDRLEEKQREEYDQAVLKEDALLISELVSSKHIRETAESRQS